MAVRDDFSPGTSLAALRELGADVRVHCCDCMLARDLNLDAVIARLNARGVDGAHTGIRELQRLIRAPCPRCGGRRFYTLPAYHSRPLSPDRLPPGRTN